MKKLLAFLIIMFSCCFAVPAKAQHNPYLDKKAKNKPSAVMARQNKKEMRRQKRMARKQMRRSRKRLNK